MNNILSNFTNNLLSYIYPYKCIICDNLIEINSVKFNNYICFLCENLIDFIEDKTCNICGLLLNDKNICDNCNGKKLYFIKNTSLFIYKDVIKELLHKFKFQNFSYYGQGISNIIFNYLKDEYFKFDYLTYVPMFYKNEYKRGYNQSFILALNLSKLSKIKILKNFIIKNKNIRKQSLLSREQRINNVVGAFRLNKKIQLKHDSKILIIDDIFTTGSTLNECAKILNDVGYINVYTLTIAIVEK